MKKYIKKYLVIIKKSYKIKKNYLIKIVFFVFKFHFLQ